MARLSKNERVQQFNMVLFKTSMFDPDCPIFLPIFLEIAHHENY